MKMTMRALLLAWVCSLSLQSEHADPAPQKVRLTSVAIRVHSMDKMVAFYSEAFGTRFKEVNTTGLRSQFGTINGVLFKLVPLRKKADFQGYPSHQPGFEVADIQRVIDLARKHGGRQESEIVREKERLHTAVRDPDGNTVELYQVLKRGP